MPIWKKWSRDKSPNVRRAVEVGLLRIPKQHTKEALKLIEPLLKDKNGYVRKNCGPFALAAVCYRDKELAFATLKKWTRSKDEQIRWNVAMCFGTYFGNKYPEESIKILKILSTDKRKYAWRVVASSLIKLLRRHPHLMKEVLSWKNCNEMLRVVEKYVK